MSDDTEVIEQETEKTGEVETQPKPSIDDVVNSRMDEASKKVESKIVPASEPTETIEKKVETKGERIQ